jgi:hypothetical protein
MRIESWVYDLVFCVFAWLMYREGCKIYGREKALIFLWGSLIWTGVIENANVIIGGYDYFAYDDYYHAGENLIKGYGGWISWILFVPLSACLGWFLLSFPAFMISTQIWKNKNIWIASSIGAVLLVSFDVFFDPMAVVNEWWRWTMPGFYYKGVPLGNWIGWFFLLFFFGALYDQTVIRLKGFRWLSKIERPIFHTDTLDLTGMDTKKLGKVFYFRLVVFLPIFFVTMLALTDITTKLWNNRWAPFENVFPHNSQMKSYNKAPEGIIPTQQVPTNRIITK